MKYKIGIRLAFCNMELEQNGTLIDETHRKRL